MHMAISVSEAFGNHSRSLWLRYTGYAYSIKGAATVNVKMVRMRKNGVATPRRKVQEEYAIRGALVILDVTDQGLRRPVKVARLVHGDRAAYELVEPHIVWASDNRFTLTGFERGKNDAGESVDYAQSWLCTLDFAPVADPPQFGRQPRIER